MNSYVLPMRPSAAASDYECAAITCRLENFRRDSWEHWESLNLGWGSKLNPLSEWGSRRTEANESDRRQQP